MSLILTKADGPDRPVPGKKHIPYIADDFEYEHDAFEYATSNKSIKMEHFGFSSDDSFDVKYTTDIIVRVSGEASILLAHEQLIFSCVYFRCKDYRTELPFLSKWKRICEISVGYNLHGLNLKYLLVKYLSHHRQDENHSIFIMNSVKVLKIQISLAESQHVFSRPEVLELGRGPLSEKPFWPAVNPMHTALLLQIYQSMRTKAL